MFSFGHADYEVIVRHPIMRYASGAYTQMYIYMYICICVCVTSSRNNVI